MKPKEFFVVLSGAGISKESGIPTFRDMDGLWRNYNVEEVASPVAWANNRDLVLEFYNIRRKKLYEVSPNAGHYALKDLEAAFDVQVVTQNVDDLHERAGSEEVLHLHGELKKVRSTANENLVYELDGWELKEGDTCELGSQLRPHIVWFGEAVPNLERAAEMVSRADRLLVVGTSLNVYPAASLLYYAREGVPVYLVDPSADHIQVPSHVRKIAATAAEGLPLLVKELLESIREE